MRGKLSLVFSIFILVTLLAITGIAVSQPSDAILKVRQRFLDADINTLTLILMKFLKPEKCQQQGLFERFLSCMSLSILHINIMERLFRQKTFLSAHILMQY